MSRRTLLTAAGGGGPVVVGVGFESIGGVLRGYVATSTDGVTFTRKTIAGLPTGSETYLQTVAYSPELKTFVAAGSNGTIVSSTDNGETWTYRGSFGGGSNLAWLIWCPGVGGGAGRFLTAGQLFSPDGVTWGTATSSGVNGTPTTTTPKIWVPTLNRVAAIIASRYIVLSADGYNWEAIIDSGQGGTLFAEKLTYDPVTDRLITVKDGTIDYPTWAQVNNLTSWTAGNTSPFGYQVQIEGYASSRTPATPQIYVRGWQARTPALATSNTYTILAQGSGGLGSVYDGMYSTKLGAYFFGGNSNSFQKSDGPAPSSWYGIEAPNPMAASQVRLSAVTVDEAPYALAA